MRAATRSALSSSGKLPPGEPSVRPERDTPELRIASFELEPDQLPLERNGGQALERTCAREPLPRMHGPAESELGRRVVGQRVLTDVQVALLEPEHLQRVETVGHETERDALLHDRTPELRTARAGMVQLERDLSDEPGADRTT